MIINTGQRTDIPAFYSKWLMNRIKAGYVMVRNPYYPSQVTKFSLKPDVVDVIGFCTKNPHPMLKYLDDLKDYGQFWYVTLTAYENDLEPFVPPLPQVIEDFKFLSKKLGPRAVGFRYTPIIINEKYTMEKHLETFEYITKELEGYTHLAVFGFVDLYDKIKRNHPEVHDATEEEKIKISQAFKHIAESHKMELRLCSKEKWLKDYDIDINGCMRLEDYEKAIGKTLVPKKKMQARKGYCSCFLSNDIGAYNSCLHLCVYCYANGNKALVQKNYELHNPNSPFLIGEAQPTDKVLEASQESWIVHDLFNLE